MKIYYEDRNLGTLLIFQLTFMDAEKQLVHLARKLHSKHLMTWKPIPRKRPVIKKLSPLLNTRDGKKETVNVYRLKLLIVTILMVSKFHQMPPRTT